MNMALCMFYSETKITATFFKGSCVFVYQCWHAFTDKSNISNILGSMLSASHLFIFRSSSWSSSNSGSSSSNSSSTARHHKASCLPSPRLHRVLHQVQHPNQDLDPSKADPCINPAIWFDPRRCQWISTLAGWWCPTWILAWCRAALRLWTTIQLACIHQVSGCGTITKIWWSTFEDK